MLNQSFNRSILKSGNKTRLDSTRFTTWTTTAFNNNTTTLDHSQGGSKLDETYRRTRTLIDELIEAVQQKRQLSRMGAKTVGDTNESVLDVCEHQDIFNAQPPPTTIRSPERHLISEVDLQKLELLKVIESQREYNQNLQRKCSKLETENHFFRESCASTRLGYSKMHPAQPQQVEQVSPQRIDAARLFAELQDLKQENQLLRQEAISLLKSQRY